MNPEINEVTNNSTDNPILDIVNTLQAKLNENNNTTNSPPFVNNNANNGNKIDLSGLDISKMLNLLNNSSNNYNNVNTENLNNSSSGLNLDLGTIMNVQKALSGFSKADPRKDLLTSLKPFLRETRQKNIDTYITLLGVMKAFNIFSNNKDRD